MRQYGSPAVPEPGPGQLSSSTNHVVCAATGMAAERKGTRDNDNIATSLIARALQPADYPGPATPQMRTPRARRVRARDSRGGRWCNTDAKRQAALLEKGSESSALSKASTSGPREDHRLTSDRLVSRASGGRGRQIGALGG